MHLDMVESFNREKVIDCMFDPINSEILAELEDGKKECSVLECFLSTSEVRGREHFFAEDYEKPLDNYLDIDTGKYSIDDSVELIYQQLNDL